MYVTIPKDILDQVLNKSEEIDKNFRGILLGNRLDEEHLLQIWGIGYTNSPESTSLSDINISSHENIEDSHQITGDIFTYVSEYTPTSGKVQPIGYIERDSTYSTGANDDDPIIEIREATQTSSETSNSRLKRGGETYEVAETNLATDSQIEVIHAKRDAQKRIDGLIDTDRIEDSHVAVVGIGTLGSTVAHELAKAGVGKLTLIDFDRLEIHNVVRHVCGVSDIGRKKTEAMRDVLLDTNPKITIQTADLDVNKNEDKIGDIISDVDVVAACSDDKGSKLIMNYQCLKHETPAVYSGVYERAMGGDVIRVEAGETACYDCIMGNLSEDFDRDERVSGERDYSEPSSDQPDAEPGLSTDAGFIALIQTKFIMRELLSSESYSDLTHDIVFWGNKEEYIFNKPLHSRFASSEFRDTCRTCGGDGTIETDTDMDELEIIDSIDSLDESPL